MSHGTPVFTQKHYEHIAQALHDRGPDHKSFETMTTLAAIFKDDNPKFKEALFMMQCMRGVERGAVRG